MRKELGPGSLLTQWNWKDYPSAFELFISYAEMKIRNYHQNPNRGDDETRMEGPCKNT